MSEDILNNNDELNEISKVIPISGMYQNWFLDYASYVILERAVPFILDGLKPVQRRILHSLKEFEAVCIYDKKFKEDYGNENFIR